MRMRCEFCGEEISPGALACPRCGGPVSKPAADAVAPNAPQGAGQPSPGQPEQHQPPPDPPLAKLEEDFIALAEESVVLEDDTPADTGHSRAPSPAGGVAALADQSVPPGAHIVPDQYVPENDLTGGYKGPEGTSVAGAGVQTADDPFGLNITETAPPAASDERVVWARSWRYSSWWNITMMIVGIVILVAGVGLALYFGVIRKSGPGRAPVEALRSYVIQVVSGDTARLNTVAAPGSQLAQDIATLLKGYEKYGVITLKGFDTKTVKITDTSATVQITRMDIELQDEKGNKENLSVLNMTKPFELNRVHPTIEIIKQNGQWLVKT